MSNEPVRYFEPDDYECPNCAELQQENEKLKADVARLVEALERASDYMPIETPLVRSGSTQEDIQLVNGALSNSTEHTEKYMAEVKEEAYQRGRADEAYDRN